LGSPVRYQLNVIVLASLLWAETAAAQSVSGSVTGTGTALPGVSVLIEVNGHRFGETITDDQGLFNVNLGAAANPRDVQLTFTRKGFVVASHLLQQGVLGRPLHVVLMPATGPASLSPEEQEKLKTLLSSGAGPLLFAPYAFPDNVVQTTGVKVNERLREQLQRLILTHVQMAVMEGDTRSVALTPLPLPVPADLQRLRAMGRMWGRATVLALAARDVRAALLLGDRAQREAELKRVRRYLFVERSNIGAQDELGEAKLRQLLDVVDRELKR
jgi:hypothetical protein